MEGRECTPTGRSEDRPEIAVAFHLTGKPHATIQFQTTSLHHVGVRFSIVNVRDFKGDDMLLYSETVLS